MCLLIGYYREKDLSSYLWCQDSTNLFFTLNTYESEMRMLKIRDISRNIELKRLLFIGTNESLFASNGSDFFVNIVGCK